MQAHSLASIFPAALMLSLLSACDVSGFGDSAETVAGLNFRPVELVKQGGNDACLSVAEAPATESICAIVKFNYPEVSSKSRPEIAQAINQLIQTQLLDSAENNSVAKQTLEQFADGFIDEFKKDPNTFTRWSLERTATVVYVSEHLLTLLFQEYGFSGEAHPFSGARYIVLDIQTGKVLSLSDLLNPGYEAALNVAGEQAFREARNLPEAASLDEQGFVFDNNVFVLNTNFGVTKDGLTFYFNSYEIAPYAMGSTELTIPYEDIRALIRPQGALGGRLH